MANFSTSIQAISDKRFNISLSTRVEVGDLNNKVSEIIAAHNNPAIFLDGLIPLSKKIEEIIVDVLPTGSFLK